MIYAQVVNEMHILSTGSFPSEKTDTAKRISRTQNKNDENAQIKIDLLSINCVNTVEKAVAAYIHSASIGLLRVPTQPSIS